jgi:hypothetical protein
MAKSLVELHREQGRLLERIQHQRRDLVRQTQPLRQLGQTGQALLDQARRAVALLRQHPWPLAAVAVTVLLLRPRRAWRWASRAWWVWRTARRLVPASLWQQLFSKGQTPRA